MKILKFNKKSHMRALASILSTRGSYVPTKEETPEIGYLALKGGIVVATAFLRRCEGGYAQIDGLTSNQHCPSQDRHVALNKVIQKCIEKAKELEIKQLFAFSMDSSTIERSIKMGFVKLPHTLLGIDIQKAKL